MWTEILQQRTHLRFNRLAVGLICVLGLIGRSVAAESPEPNPSDPADQHVWHLNDYLKGPPAKIRDLINSELERLTVKQNDLKHRCSGYDAEILAQQNADVRAARKSDNYVKLAAQKNAAEATLKDARENGTPQEKLDASSAFNRVRMAMEKIENDAVASDRKIPQMLKDKREDTAELKRCDEAVETARNWRNKLISAIRDTFKMTWPLKPGASGILGTVTPLEDPDKNGITVDFVAYELGEKGGTQEGITQIKAIVHKVRLHVTGIDTTGMSKGTPVNLDRNFAVTGKTDDDGAYEVRPRKDDVDRLFELLIPLRDTSTQAK